MTTRANILSRAFSRIGIADYEYSVTPEERAEARDILDAMLVEWDSGGVKLGYTPVEDADDSIEMTTPDWADAAIWSNLALRLAASFGKAPGSGLVREARRGFDMASAKTVSMPVVARGRSSLGERYYRRFGW